MKRFLFGLAGTLALASVASAQEAPDKVTPLFAQDTPLDLTLSGPINKIARGAERSTDAYPATLETAGESHAITLAARGISRRRRENCRFPPLRIRLSEKPAETSLMHKQGSLKLVSHCRDQGSYDQTVLREYAAYRLYNAVTPESLKVRLARITYNDDGKVLTTRLGFLIEDADDAARRLGLKEVDTGNFRSSALIPQDAARYGLFQYMIGNTDWDMTMGPDPKDCCHNSKVLGASKEARSDLTPLPYDFDNSGLVDAPYAVPNAVLKIRSVTQRVYRGYCSVNALVPAEAQRLRDARPALLAELRSIPGLEPKTLQDMEKYLGGFFDDIADDQALEKNLLSKCR
ncbi:hypothetical protein P7228_07650 [Altererythrobacter arenosus]|uniref:Uncharacterized protein n=1 Tax=Altererythrobacter arenosus TaxID=3032592 RepID=A0ABY8FVA0_9SPHN|nr:hypothetical protein [Altererythrobacter sp. CAU 1644]WFL78927.1 hypothetical protein P7228_07650 [Altererythrobacter sp. CAU 1644]